MGVIGSGSTHDSGAEMVVGREHAVLVRLSRRLVMRGMPRLVDGHLGAPVDCGDLLAAGLLDREHDRDGAEGDGADRERDRTGGECRHEAEHVRSRRG
jgi:hypothetical protein